MRRKRWAGWVMVAGMIGLVLAGTAAQAAEHGGKEHGGAATQEHGGQEHGGMTTQAAPTADAIRAAIQAYATKGDEFTIHDPVTGAQRSLSLVRVHERVGKTGELYYSCTDMQDLASGELLDLDFDVDASGGTLTVVDERIHKVNGEARYTYDEHDNRIPLQ